MKPKISLITLGVSDLAQSRRFYAALGFPAQDDNPDIVFFRLEGTWLALYPREKLAADVPVSPGGSGFSGFTLAHNVASKAEVDAVFAAAIAAGARPRKTPRDASWGGYSGYFADPDGYLWEVAWNPFTDLT